ncbi:MAG: glutamate--tRNA ligase [Alphaproteobacteria bacterium]|nr:glutamate--tRNA ligase [Alphaproteobacteria bacterium]
MTTTVRFAPSPTGKLHVGNIRAALTNYLFARKTGGKFLLRLDDTDTERSTEENAQGIERDLAWLGLKHDLFAKQSDRTAPYEAAAEKLRAAGRLYACYETADELDRRRKRQLAQHKPPIYDRAALNLTAEQKAELEAKGRKPHWRFKLTGNSVEFNDLIRGPVHIETASLSDPVLIREDGRFLYTLPSVVDDIDFAISHIIRGEDHVTNTGVQIEIFEALGAKAPTFAHFSMLIGAGGEALSKRLGSLSIEGLRADGIEPQAVNSLLAKLGTSDPVVARMTLDELVADFDLTKFSRAPAHFDPNDLKTLNHKLLHAMPFEAVADELKRLGVGGGAPFWNAIHDNIQLLNEAPAWWRVVEGPIEPVIEDAAVAAEARELLPKTPFTDTTWTEWTAAVSAKTGAKGKALFRPLRLALTGQPHGPEMRKLLPLIGPERAAKRLAGQAA